MASVFSSFECTHEASLRADKHFYVPMPLDSWAIMCLEGERFFPQGALDYTVRFLPVFSVYILICRFRLQASKMQPVNVVRTREFTMALNSHISRHESGRPRTEVVCCPVPSFVHPLTSRTATVLRSAVLMPCVLILNTAYLVVG